MTKDYYKKALEAARKELSELEAERTKLDKRINELRQGIVGLTALAQDEESGEKPQTMMDVLTGVGVETGLTDATRMITGAFGFPMTPVQVRDSLLKLGYDLSGYSNVVASLHTIMKRLRDKGELIAVTDDKGKELGAYVWNQARARSLPQAPPREKFYGGGLPTKEITHKADDSEIQSLKETGVVIDPFVGHGSSVANKTDIVVTNPPYKVPAKTPGKGKNKHLRQATKSSVSYEGLGLTPPQRRKVDPGKRDVSVLDQRKKKD